MKKIPPELLIRMAEAVSAEDRDEMAIPSYLHANPALRWMAWRRLEVVARFLDDLAGRQPLDTCVDFGCGTGLLTERMSPHASSIVALDSSNKMIAILNNKNLPNVTTVAEELSAELINKNASLNNRFDLIVASSVFAFLPDYESK